MKDPFICKTSSGKTIGDIAFAALEKEDAGLTVVDAGARNGMFLVPCSYAGHATFIGFEPNPEEYRKLVEHNTDAMKVGALMPGFKAEQYYDCALWDGKGTLPFYVTRGPGACTLMGKSDSSITNRMFLDGGDSPYEEAHSKVTKTIQMKCDRLDNILDPGRKIDFLKLDVEGAEFAVLKGAEGMLKRKNILFIKSEFQAFPYYENHPLLGHQQIFLSDHGFRLVGLDLNHPPYGREKRNMPVWADRRLVYAGDAYFVIDPDRNELTQTDLARLALVCLIFGFNSLALSLFHDSGLIGDENIDAIRQALIRGRTSRRLLHVWDRIPSTVYRAIRFCRRG